MNVASFFLIGNQNRLKIWFIFLRTDTNTHTANRNLKTALEACGEQSNNAFIVLKIGSIM